MHDGATAHKSKAVTKLIYDNNISVLEWPGNSPDLNTIKNAWNLMKNELEKLRPTSIPDLKEVLKKLWITMDSTYFTNLASSMPRRIHMVVKSKGNMIKY